jgi:tetratricopeptide (TPR) repeat protein
MLTGWVHGGVHGRNALWGEAAERALTHYRRSGWPASSCLGQIASALYFGPTPVVEAIARGEALVAEAEDFAGAASIRAYVGGLEAMRGRFDRAFELLTESRAVLEQLGQTAIVAHTWLPIRGFVESLADDPAAAEQSLRTSCVLLERIRDRNALSTQAAELAEVIYQQGRYDEAEQWAHVSRENAASDDIGSQCVSRAVIAKLSARRGELPMAQALAREAVSLAATTDNLNRRARVQLDLGEVLSLSGLLYEADAAARDAASLFEQKGNLVACGKARVLPLEPAGA